MARTLPWLLLVTAVGVAHAAENLARNPSFEADANGDGTPHEWQWAGDSRLVTQSLTLDKGRDGKRCAKLACTRFAAGNPAAHAMLAQLGIPVKRGTSYRVAFWARAENIECDVVSIALSDTSVWASCGLGGAFAPTAEWQRFEFFFQATRDCPAKSRFQIWFGSTGTLWVDDVEFVESGPQARRPGHIIPSAGKKNLIPNASFEIGTDGWGSNEAEGYIHWATPMNARFGSLDWLGRSDDRNPFHGRKSFRIGLSEKTVPVAFFDYYALIRRPLWAPLAANIGWIEVEPGKPYTLSTYLKGDKAGVPARLSAREFERGRTDKLVAVSDKWERYALTFTPRQPWCFVAIGPDLRKSPEKPNPPDKATLWIDAVQLEQGAEPTAFAPRDACEFYLRFLREEWDECVLRWKDGLDYALLSYNDHASMAQRTDVEFTVTDFFDRALRVETKPWTVKPGDRSGCSAFCPPDPRLRGFLRIHAKAKAGRATEGFTARLAIVPEHEGTDSRFGVNHAYPWPHLLNLCQRAGILWVRDWSLKWQEVEPEKGKFSFTETDYQIDRPIKHGLKVLGLLPFPSANWSSSAPESVKVTAQYPGNRARVAYAPRDEAEFENYVAKTVEHYKGRITWWQCFNEPIFTDYSLPRKHGYTGKDYAKWAIAFARAAKRANPDCKVLAGMGYISEGQIMKDFEEFFAAGGLAACDAVDIHHYPRIRPPEFIEPLLEQLNALMDKHGGRKPLWLTEYGYYADDEPAVVPMPHSDFDTPLPSERVQAEYAVRWATLCFANGVEKVFYHAGTCGGINSDSLQGVFYKYGGQPKKIYAAQAVMAHLLTPTCRFVRKLALGEGIRACLFRDGKRHVCVVWAPKAGKPRPIRLADEKLALWDIMGRPQKEREFTPSSTPVYVIAGGMSDQAFESALR